LQTLHAGASDACSGLDLRRIATRQALFDTLVSVHHFIAMLVDVTDSRFIGPCSLPSSPRLSVYIT
jgi:hypothetical protein